MIKPRSIKVSDELWNEMQAQRLAKGYKWEVYLGKMVYNWDNKLKHRELSHNNDTNE